MWLTRLAIARPIVIWMTLIALSILGIISYFRLPAELNPRVDIPTLTITTVYPGAGPQEVESLVTKQIEDAVGSVPNVKDVFSSSQDSVSIVSIDLNIGSDLDKAISASRDKIEAIRASLPNEIRPPVVAKLDINAQPVLYVAITATSSLHDLRKTVERDIRPKIARVPGVATVNIVGGVAREVKVAVDPLRLQQYHITIEDVVDALKAAGRNVPGGSIVQGKSVIDVRTVGAFTDLEQIRASPINSQHLAVENGGRSSSLPLTIADVASVAISNAEQTSITRVNGKDSVGIILSKTADSNTVAVVNAVKETLTAARATLPKDSQIITSRDDSEVVKDALDDVNVSLILGSILAMTVVFLFLHNLRGTIIVAIALPSCLIFTFLALYLFGYTLNQMTLLALSLSVGILIDDSIVVLESITRHLRLGETPAEAAYNGRTEIGFADITTTLSDVVVYLPIAFMGGIVGAFFKQFGVTVVVATLFSLIVSFTVTPALASRWYRTGEKSERTKAGIFGFIDKFYEFIELGYRRLLVRVLSVKWWVAAFGLVVLLAVLLITVPFLGTDLLPATDMGQIAITVELPPGTSLTATDAVARSAEQSLQEFPDIANEVTTVGEILGGFGAIPQRGSQFAQINVRLKSKLSVIEQLFSVNKSGSGNRKRDDSTIAGDIRKRLASIPGARFAVSAIRSASGTGLPIQLQLRGNDLDALKSAAVQIRDRMAQMPGISDPDISLRTGKPEIEIHPDRPMAASLGVPISLIGSIVRDAIEGNSDIAFRDGAEDLPLHVQIAGIDRNEESDLNNITVGYQSGRSITLGEVTTAKRTTGPAAIDRINGQRMITISADIAPKYSLGNAQADITKRLADIPMQGIEFQFGGDSEAMNDNIPYFASALGLAVILAYLVMASLFNSLMNPLVIMFSLPMALAGALSALVLSGETISLVSMIGIIMLVGLMGRNAILLIDYTGTLRSRGLSRDEAIIEGGATRLRPILMTSIATIAGMIPVALRIGRASELRAPMAIVVIGGMLVSTFLTLLMIPALYSIADDVSAKFRGKQTSIIEL